jgi:hypothetical protein
VTLQANMRRLLQVRRFKASKRAIVKIQKVRRRFARKR